MSRYSSCNWTSRGRTLRRRAATRLAPTLLGLALLGFVLAACEAEAPNGAQNLGLAGEYVDVERDEDRAVVLRLEDDGTFEYLKGPRERGEVSPPSELLGEGTWTCVADNLLLEGEGWTTRFVADSIWVEIPRRAAMLRSLRWVTSTEGAPFSACNLVLRSDFNELLHPSAGTGSAQSAW
ncbi:MAG: hypothetical protein JXB46_08470 [Candidatus Eisenbacteria bacterium]|nr:hypothetical protein [Candidatus Eisenbacteria bacterium]